MDRGVAPTASRILIEGLVLQRILTPELCPDEVFFAAFGALAHHRGEPNLNATPVAEEPSAGKGPASDWVVNKADRGRRARPSM